MPSPQGRRPGREPSAVELTHLRLLIEMRALARSFDARLEDFVLRLRDDGCSNRTLAEALGVGTATVQGWAANARRRRDA